MCWQYLCPDWTAPASASFAVQDVLVSLKEKIAQPFSMDIIMLVSWEIWTTQNGYILKKILLISSDVEESSKMKLLCYFT
jgi:hypothetical protein